LEKAPDAFRIISEVATELDVPQHVLRFWESRFNQIRPMKRGGGRRYYRRDDIDLLRGIRHLLYGEGYMIRGVQRLLREQGVGFVQAVWQTGASAPPPDESSDVVRAEGPTARDHLLLGLLPKLSRSKSADEAAELDVTEEDDGDDEASAGDDDSDSDGEFEQGTDGASAVATDRKAQPARLLREQVIELQSALDELGECRRLIDSVLEKTK
jgi:DNA-binding transcriptional MerR regulator